MHVKTVSSITTIKFYSTKELAALYEVSSKTLNKWIRRHEKKIGTKEGRFYNTSQVKTIFELIGLPQKIIECD